jgi:hypothetical protein
MTDRLPLEGTLLQYAKERTKQRLWTFAALVVWSAVILWLVGHGSFVLSILLTVAQPIRFLLAIVQVEPPSGKNAFIAFWWLLLAICSRFSVLELVFVIYWIVMFPLHLWNRLVRWVKGYVPLQFTTPADLLPLGERHLPGLRPSPKQRRAGTGIALQFCLVWWFVFGESASIAVFFVAAILGIWLMAVCAIRVFERVVVTVERSITVFVQLGMFVLAMTSVRAGDAVFRSADPPKVVR